MRRPQPGDRHVPVEALTGPADRLDGLEGPVLPDGSPGPTGQAVLPPRGEETILARITAKNAAVPPAYSWQRVGEGTAGHDGVTGIHPDDPYVGGNPDYYPAYEENGNASVPVGSVVRLHRAAGPAHWWFTLPAGAHGGAPLTPITGITQPPGTVILVNGLPATATPGQMFLNVLDNKVYIWTGTGWLVLCGCEFIPAFASASGSGFSPGVGGGTVQTPCCAQPVPAHLIATVDDLGGCACLNNLTVSLVYSGLAADGVSPTWRASGTECGKHFELYLICNAGPSFHVWMLALSCDAAGHGPQEAVQAACGPLHLQFKPVPADACCAGGDVEVNVFEAL